MSFSVPPAIAGVKRLLPALALGLFVNVGMVHAQAPEPGVKPEAKDAQADPKAKELLTEVAKAYKALNAYSDEGQFVVAMEVNGKAQKQVLPLKLTFARPNKLNLNAGPVRLNSDGATMSTVIEPLKRYTEEKAPDAISIETFRQGPLGAVLFGGPSGAPMFVVLSLLTSPDAPAALEQLGGTLKIAPEDPKTKVSGLLIDQEEGPDIRLNIDPATKLLSGIDFLIDPAMLVRNVPEGQKLQVNEFGWKPGAVKTEPTADEAFAFKAPEGFAKVESLLEGQGGGQEPKYAIDSHVGGEAPDFTLTLLDGPDKTKTVTKADLAGKVVVIDFWATWCGPCLQELPEIQKLVESLDKDGKEVVLVALSQDSDPQELSEVRKLVEKTLSDKKLNLTVGKVGQIGLDPSGSVGKAFDVEGYPTLVILDGKGTVQAAHVGFKPGIGKDLATEIDTLLSGKPLFTPKPEEAAKKPGAEDGEK